ncbi:MAG: hypothetical protein U1F43_30435 [Myxococcota bacterium]
MVGSFATFFQAFSFEHLLMLSLAFALGIWVGWWVWGKLARKTVELELKIIGLERELRLAQEDATEASAQAPMPAPAPVTAPISVGGDSAAAAELATLRGRLQGLEDEAQAARQQAQLAEKARVAAEEKSKLEVDAYKGAELALAQAKADAERHAADVARLQAELDAARAAASGAPQTMTPAEPAPAPAAGASDAERAELAEKLRQRREAGE